MRNLDKHKNSCPMRQSGENKEDVESAASSGSISTATLETHPTTPPTNKEREKGDTARDEENAEERSQLVAQGPGQGDPSRTVTCMRCQESLPFLLVPSHGAKCKGKKESGFHLGATAAAPPVASERQEQELSLRCPAKSTEIESKSKTLTAAAEKSAPSEGLSQSSISGSDWRKSPSPLTSPRDLGMPRPFSSRLGAPLSPPAAGTKAWHGACRTEEGVPPGAKVPLSPARSKNVRTWGTRQVTSWLRDIMRPPRADVISRFHDGGVDGTTLLGITDRYRWRGV